MVVVYYLILNLVVVYMVLLIYIITNIKRRSHTLRVNRITKKFKVLFDKCEEIDDYHLSDKFIKSLKKTIRLEAFFDAINELENEQRTRVMLDNNEAILRLISREKNKIIHAYFAYMLQNVDLSEEKGDGYGPLMLELLNDNSIYTRENALKAIYSFKNAKLVADSLIKLTNLDIPHNDKLLADGMLTFDGDVKQLADLLMLKYEDLLECYRNALINFLNYKSINDYDDLLIEDAQRENVSVDTICCIIRKINKSKSEKNLEFLMNLIKRFKEGNIWEPVAIAVAGLANYGEYPEVKELLKKEVISRNWYIRKNAANSLATIGLSDDDLEEIYSQNDRFANDAIKYAMGRA